MVLDARGAAVPPGNRTRASAQAPMTVLRRSSSSTSRHTPWSCPSRSRRPTTRKPHFSCSVTLATFSGKMPACSVHRPARSDASTSAESSRPPTPCPRAPSPTYTLTSPTPPYTQRDVTGLRAAHPRRRSRCRATSRQSARWVSSQCSHSGTSVSKVARPVASPSGRSLAPTANRPRSSVGFPHSCAHRQHRSICPLDIVEWFPLHDTDGVAHVLHTTHAVEHTRDPRGARHHPERVPGERLTRR